MEVQDLGPVFVVRDGHDVPAGPPMQRALLGILALEAPQGVPVPALIDHLWGDEPPATAVKSIQKYVAQLRKALGRDAIARDSGAYRLTVPESSIDSRRFVESVASAREIADPSARSRVLSAALQLFRGEVLPGLDTAYANLERARFEELRLSATEDFIHTLLDEGRPARAAADAEHFVQRHPFREGAWTALMLALYRSGRQQESLAAYQRLRAHLREELGVDPSPEVRKLEQAILDQDPAIDGPAEAASDYIEMDERRSVTVVAAHPGGPMEPEQWERASARLTDLLGRIATVEGGMPVVAGAPTVVFGAPAIGDEAARAARAALLAAQDETGPRLGIASGRAVVRGSASGLDLVGDVVSRVQSLAMLSEPGEVTVDAEVATQLAEHAIVSRRTSGVYVVQQLVTDPEPGGHSVFVGRNRELEDVIAALASAARDSEPHLVAMVGEAGIGKTSLVDAVRGEARPSETLWIQTAVRPFGDEPYSVIRRLLDQAPRRDLPEWVSAAVTRLRDSTTHELDGDGDGLLRAWSLALVDGRPRVIVVEDLHYADATVSAFLEELLRVARGTPTVVICTARPVERTWPLFPEGARRSVRIVLDGLDAATSQALLATIGVDIGSDDDRQAVLDRSGGNPLFLTELARAWREGAGALDLPASVEACIISRLDELTTFDRLVVELVSVAAAKLDPAAISAVLDLTPPDTFRRVERLRRLGLLDIDPHGPASEYRVRHTLIAEAARRLVPDHRSKQWHLDLASRFEGEPAEMEWLSAVVFHLGSALALSDGDVTLRHRLGCAQFRLGRALAAVDVGRASSMLDGALENLSPQSREFTEAELLAGRSAAEQGRWDSARRHLDGALDRLAQDGHHRAEARGRIYLATALWYQGDADAMEQVERAIEMLRDDPCRELAYGMAFRVAHLSVSGAPMAALELAEQVRQIIDEHGSVSDHMRLHNGVGVAHLELGDPAGFNILRAGIDLGKQTGRWRVVGTMVCNLAYHTWLIQGPSAATPIFREGIEIASDLAQDFLRGWLEVSLAEVLIDAGQWEEAVELASGVTQRSGGPSLVVDSACWVLGVIALHQGRPQEARALISEATVDRLRTFGDLNHLSPWLAALGMQRLADGDHAEAIACIREMADRTTAHPTERCHTLPESVAVLLEAGEVELASSIVPHQRQLTTRNELCRRTALKLVAARNEPRAVGDLQEIAEAWRSFGSPFREACVLLEAAEAADRLGTATVTSVDTLEAALDVFQALEADRWTTRTRAQIARIRGT